MDHTGWLQGFYTTKSYGRALMQFMVNGTEADAAGVDRIGIIVHDDKINAAVERSA